MNKIVPDKLVLYIKINVLSQAAPNYHCGFHIIKG